MDNVEQLDLFGRPEISIDRKIRLIELFAGYGSQAMALERMGVDFETHFVCELTLRLLNHITQLTEQIMKQLIYGIFTDRILKLPILINTVIS